MCPPAFQHPPKKVLSTLLNKSMGLDFWGTAPMPPPHWNSYRASLRVTYQSRQVTRLGTRLSGIDQRLQLWTHRNWTAPPEAQKPQVPSETKLGYSVFEEKITTLLPPAAPPPPPQHNTHTHSQNQSGQLVVQTTQSEPLGTFFSAHFIPYITHPLKEQKVMKQNPADINLECMNMTKNLLETLKRKILVCIVFEVKTR